MLDDFYNLSMSLGFLSIISVVEIQHGFTEEEKLSNEDFLKKLKNCFYNIFSYVRPNDMYVNIFYIFSDLNEARTKHATQCLSLSDTCRDNLKLESGGGGGRPCFYLSKIFADNIKDNTFYKSIDIYYFANDYVKLSLKERSEIVALMILSLYFGFIYRLLKSENSNKNQEIEPVYQRITAENIYLEMQGIFGLLNNKVSDPLFASCNLDLLKENFLTGKNLMAEKPSVFKDNARIYKQYYRDRVDFVNSWHKKIQKKREYNLLFIRYNEVSYLSNFFQELILKKQKRLMYGYVPVPEFFQNFFHKSEDDFRFGIVVQGKEHCVGVDCLLSKNEVKTVIINGSFDFDSPINLVDPATNGYVFKNPNVEVLDCCSSKYFYLQKDKCSCFYFAMYLTKLLLSYPHISRKKPNIFDSRYKSIELKDLINILKKDIFYSKFCEKLLQISQFPEIFKKAEWNGAYKYKGGKLE